MTAYPAGPLWTRPKPYTGVPRQAFPGARYKRRPAAITPNPDFPPELRPTATGPCVLVEHGTPGEVAPRALRLVRDGELYGDPSSAAHLATESRWFAETPETRCPAWWRERLPDVAFTLWRVPGGLDAPGTRELVARVGADEAPQPVVVVAPQRERVTVSGVGTFDAVRAPDGALTLVLPPAMLAACQRVGAMREAVPVAAGSAREALFARKEAERAAAVRR